MSLYKNNFLDLITVEIEESYGIIIPDHTEEEQIIYTLFRLGIFQKKLFVDFMSGRAINYTVHYFIFNFKIL